ncbi:MAG: PDZ domain-containing protein [Calditrichaeota bacterium]|nr:MAG: PDZ domain-containing protein [Calditrichota bacterium]
MRRQFYFDRHPQVFRILLGFAAFIILWIWSVALYNVARRATDENIFRDIPTPLYVKASLPSQLVATDAQKPTVENGNPQQILSGDILVSINGKSVQSKKAVHRLISEIPDDSRMILQVLKPALDRRYNYSVKRSDFSLRVLRDLGPAVYVTKVFSGGASERAGMKAGDLIVSINGKDFKDMMEADAIMARGRSGSTVQYVILRENSWHTLQVTLVQFEINLSYIVFSICGLIVLGVGLFIGMRKAHFIAARLIGMALFLSGCFFALSGALHFRISNPFHSFILTLVIVFSFSIWIHSRIYFPSYDPGLHARIWNVRIAYIFSLIIAFSFFIFNSLLMAVLAILFSIFFVFVFFTDLRAQSQENKQIMRPVNYLNVAGMLLAVVIAVFVQLGGFKEMDGYAGLPILTLPFSYMYVIGRYRLLELDLRLRKNIQYVIVTSAWATILIVAIIYFLTLIPNLTENLPAIYFSRAILEISRDQSDSAAIQMTRYIVLMTSAVIIAYLGLRVGRIGQSIIDRKFFRNKYNYQVTTRLMARILTKQLSLLNLGNGIIKMLTEEMQLKRAAIVLFRNESECCCQESIGFAHNQWVKFCSDSLTEMNAILQDSSSDSRYSINTFPQNLQTNFKNLGVYHILKITSQGKLLGAVLIGEKRSETAFHRDDLDFLSYVSHQAAVAIENAFLHEVITEQERFKHELAIARRIQLSSLPTTAPELPGLEICGTSVPAMEVGGDYFDYLNGQDGHLTVIVGDVSGKGTSAALYMSRMQGIMRSLNTFNLLPRELFIRANVLLKQNLDKQFFMTILGGHFNCQTKTMLLARAGHLPLFYYNRKKNKVESVTPDGIGLGLNSNGIFDEKLQEQKIKYHAGDVFLFVTDGITEAVDAENEEFGEHRVLSILEKNHHKTADELCHLLMSTINDYESRDDQTIVVVKVKPEGA